MNEDRVSGLPADQLPFNLLNILIIARIIFSYFPRLRYGRGTAGQIYRLVEQLTEPLLAPLRRIIPGISMGGGAYLDLTPLVAVMLLNFIRRLIMA